MSARVDWVFESIPAQWCQFPNHAYRFRERVPEAIGADNRGQRANGYSRSFLGSDKNILIRWTIPGPVRGVARDHGSELSDPSAPILQELLKAMEIWVAFPEPKG